MKRKELWIGIGVIALLFIIAFYLDAKSKTNTEPAQKEEVSQVEERVVEDSGNTLDIQNASYTIGADAVELVDGIAQRQGRMTALLEGPAFTDLNRDGVKDAIVLLKDDVGAGSVLYYVAAVFAEGDTQKTSNSILLGDRIRIKEIAVNLGVISVTILERGASENMTALPSLEKTLQFVVEGETLVQVK